MNQPNQSTLIIPARYWSELRDYLLGDPLGHERYALLRCGVVRTGNRIDRLLVRHVAIPVSTDLVISAPHAVEPDFDLLLPQFNRCAASGLVPLCVHSHPGSIHAKFSQTDDKADAFVARLWGKIYGQTAMPVSAVLAKNEIAVRQFNPTTKKLESLHSVVLDWPWPNPRTLEVTNSSSPGLYDRQNRFLGTDGQAAFANCKIGVVGAGGTGSFLIEQLVRIGIRSFVVCDEDRIETSNLSRLAGAAPSDVGRLKVELARDVVLRFAPHAHFEFQAKPFEKSESSFRHVDYIFGCVDSEIARSQINSFAIRYLTPYFDLATGISTSEGKLQGISAECRVVLPGQSRCLICGGEINVAALMREQEIFENGERWDRAGYLTDAPETPTPSIVTANVAIVAAAVFELLKAITGVSQPIDLVRHDLIKPFSTGIRMTRRPECSICGENGFLGLGDLDAEGYCPETSELSENRRRILEGWAKRLEEN